MGAAGGVGGDLAAVLSGLAALQADVSGVKADVSGVKAAVSLQGAACARPPSPSRAASACDSHLSSPRAYPRLAPAAADATRPSVEVRLWARPGFFSAKLHDDFDAFRASVAAAVRADLATMRLYYFPGSVVVAERVAISNAASLRAFASARREVWVYEPAAAGPPSPDEPPVSLPDATPFVPSASSGRSSAPQRYFRAAVLKRDGAACVLCGLVDKIGGKSHLEAAHVVAASTPARILDEIPMHNPFDTHNGITLCADCHHWYDRHMWHVDGSGMVRVADALRLREGFARWAERDGRPLRLPLSPQSRALWPLPHYWSVQERLCLAAGAARAERVAERPFFCDFCGARAKSERGLQHHRCGTDRHVYTPLLVRAFPAAAAAAASLGTGDGEARELFGDVRDDSDDAASSGEGAPAGGAGRG